MRTKLAFCANLLGLIVLGMALVFTIRMPVGLEPAALTIPAGFQSLRFLNREESGAEWRGQRIQCLKNQDLNLADFRAYAAKHPTATVAALVDDKPAAGATGLLVTYEFRYENEWVRDCTRSIQELRPAGWPNWAGVAKVDLDRGQGVATVHPKNLWMNWVGLGLSMLTLMATAFSGLYWLGRWRSNWF